MVHNCHQHVLVVGNSEKLCVKRTLAGQVEGVAGRVLNGYRQLSLRPPAGIDRVIAEFGMFGRDDDLVRYAVC